MKNTGLAIFLSAFLSACAVSGSRSTLDEKIAYNVTRERAKEIVESSISAFIPADYIHPVHPDSLTSSGYVRILVDTSTTNATAIPAKGLAANGRMEDGYGFIVSYYGTIAFPSTPRRVYNFIKQQASTSGETLRTQ